MQLTKEISPFSCGTGENGGVEWIAFTGSNPIEIDDEGVKIREFKEGEQTTIKAINPNGEVLTKWDAYCDWWQCWNYGMYIDWESKILNSLASDDGVDEDPVNFTADKLAFVVGGAELKDGWQQATDGPELDAVITDGLPDSICPGDFASLNLELDNTHICASIDATVNIKNHLTGKTFTKEVTVDPDFNETIFYNFDVPTDVEMGKKDVLTIEVNSAAEDITKTVSSTVGNTGNFLTINSVTAPDQACPTTSIDIETTAKNSGKCDVEAKAVLTNDVNDQKITTEASTIFASGTNTFRFNPQVPQTQAGSVTYTVDIVSGGSVLASQSLDITTQSTEVGISSTDAPQSICLNNSFNLSTTVTNNGECPASLRVLVNNNLTGEQKTFGPTNLSAGNSTTANFNVEMPLEASDVPSVDYDVTLQLRADGGWQTKETQTVTVEALKPSVSIQSASAPEEACVGNQIIVSSTAVNDSECGTSIKLQLTEEFSGQTKTFGPASISPGNTVTAEFKSQLTTELVGTQAANYTLRLLRETTQGFKEVENTNLNVTTLESELEIVENPYPEFQQPGQASSVIKVKNTGKCSAKARVTSGQLSKEIQVAEGQTATITHNYKVLAEDVTFNVKVQNLTLNRTSDELTQTISPYKYVEVSTSKGFIEIVGGFSQDVFYNASLTAASFEGTEDLEGMDTLIGRVGLGKIEGNALKDPEDVDIYNFNSLQFLNMQVEKDIMWVVDNKIAGKSKTFQYSTLSGSKLNDVEDLPAEDPNISVTAGPLSNVGTLRRNVGIDARIIQTPILTRLTLNSD